MKEISLKIMDIDCAACVTNINSALSKVDGIHRVSTNFSTGRCFIEFDEEKQCLEDIALRIKRAGYKIPIETVEIKTGNDVKTDDTIKVLSSIWGVKSVSYHEEKHCFIVEKWPIHLESNRILTVLKQNQIDGEVILEQGGEEDIEIHKRILLLKSLCFAAFFTLPILWDLHPYIQFVLASIVQFGAGRILYKGALRAIKGKSFNMDFLVSMSTTIIYFFSVYETFSATVDIKLYFLCECTLLTLILFGKYVENISKNEASDAIRKLMRLQPDMAVVECNGKEVEVSIEQITPDDVIIIRPGERIPVDGRVIDGKCAVDESMLTGESSFVDKKADDLVYCGTLNRSGSIRIIAEKSGKGTILSQIIDIVNEAQNSKAPIQRFADKVANYFIPGIVFVSMLVFFAWYFYIRPGDMEQAVYCVCSVLVIACPCAFGLATPTGIMVGSGRAAELGILFKNAEQLENAYKVTDIVFDKTGTLTQGEPEVTDIIEIGEKKEKILYYAAAVERMSEHPIALAIVNYCKKNYAIEDIVNAKDFMNIENWGVSGIVDGKTVVCGGRKALTKREVNVDGIEYALSNQGKTEVCISVDGKIAGMIGIADRIRPDASKAVAVLKKQGLDVWMMTGDNEKTAKMIASQAGIDNILWEVRPDGKAEEIKKLQGKGKKVAMVGDGINDAPAIVMADLGIAMSSGTDIAIESADVMLLGGNIKVMPKVIAVSEKTMKNIKGNLCWALFYNAVFIPIAACGFINPAVAAAAMSLSSNGVLMNALRLNKMEAENGEK